MPNTHQRRFWYVCSCTDLYRAGGETVLRQRKEDLEAAHQHVKGLMSYTLVRSEDGGVAITVCREKAGAHESVRVAKEWLEKNAPGVTTNPPQLIEGAVIIHI